METENEEEEVVTEDEESSMALSRFGVAHVELGPSRETSSASSGPPSAKLFGVAFKSSVPSPPTLESMETFACPSTYDSVLLSDAESTTGFIADIGAPCNPNVETAGALVIAWKTPSPIGGVDVDIVARAASDGSDTGRDTA